jgi:MscS family membrane protein
MEAFEGMLEYSVAGVSVRAMLVALVAVAIGFFLGGRIDAWTQRLADRIDPTSLRRAALLAIGRPLGWVVRAAGIWGALRAMPLTQVEAFDVGFFIDRLIIAVTVVLATWLGVRAVDELAAVWGRRAQQTEGSFDDQLVPVVRKAVKVFFVITGAVMVVQNLGYSVASLLAGVGIGGAALAFASKDAVANVFGSIVIFVDRPFMVGDWIEIGETEGTVETVGIRVTRVRTFANSVVTIPNAQFTTLPIHNWSRMRKRRIKIDVGLTYDAEPDQLRAAVEAIRTIIRGDDRLDQDFFLVNFHDFGESSLNIFCYLFTRTTNWTEHMQVREEFLLAVMEAMAKLRLEFAFPTRTVHLQQIGPRGLDEVAAQPPGAPRAMLRQRP